MSEVLHRRGVHQLADIEIATAFPFGLIESRTRASLPTEIVVYPRVYAIRQGVLDSLSGIGDVYTRAAADGDEFHSLREYVRGDDPRRIAWRVSARAGSLVVREMEAESTRTVALCLDTRRIETEDFDERFEDAVDLTASLAMALLKQRYAVGVVTPSLSLPEGEGTAQGRRVLEFLARVVPIDASVGGTFPDKGRTSSKDRTAQILISPDASRWGIRSGAGLRVVDPREVLRA